MGRLEIDISIQKLLCEKLNNKTQQNYNSKKFSYILLASVIGLIFIISFSNQLAHASSSSSTCYSDNPSICISFGDVSYMIDHGALIQVTNPTSPSTNSNGIKFVTVTVQETTPGITPSPVSVQLMQSSTTPSLYSGYVYFSNSALPYTPILSPVLAVSNPRTTQSVTIQASYVDSSESGVPINTPTPETVTDLAFDNAGHGTWPWATPSAYTQPSTYKITCPTSNPTIDPDGLCRYWKTSNGLKIPYPPQSTTLFYTYNCDTTQHPYPNAPKVGNSAIDPQCPTPGGRDIYVEVDYMTGHQPDVTALEGVIDVFASQTPSIALHIQLDEQIPLHQDTISAGIAGGSGSTQFDIIKKYYFGTSTDRTTSLNPNLSYQPNLSAKKQAFHYALVYHAQTGSTSSGYSEQPGNDMGISLGDFTGGVGSMDQLEGTFMHELGHNLGLDHGGSDSINCKPNYPSVMSYSHQFADPISDRRLDYSHGGLLSLQENQLDESKGVGTNTNHDTVSFGYIGTSDGLPHIALGKADGSAINWDHPDVANDPIDISSAMITNFPSTPRVLLGCPTETAPRTTPYPDNNDWGSLIYNFKAYTGWSDTYLVTLDNYPGMVIKLHNDAAPSPWVITWVKQFGYDRMRPIKIPTEITALDTKEFRSQLIQTIRHNIDILSPSAFDNYTINKNTLDNDLMLANNLTTNGDLIGAAHKLVDAKSYFIGAVNSTGQALINPLLDNVIDVHVKQTSTPRITPHWPISVQFDNNSYNTGDNGTITVSDTLANTDNNLVQFITASVTSSTDNTGITVRLVETGPSTGIFTGKIQFSSDSSQLHHTLKVSHGDEVKVKYGKTSATAIIL